MTSQCGTMAVSSVAGNGIPIFCRTFACMLPSQAALLVRYSWSIRTTWPLDERDAVSPSRWDFASKSASSSVIALNFDQVGTKGKPAEAEPVLAGANC